MSDSDRARLAVPATLRTTRLIGQRVRADDYGALRRLHQDPRVMATLAADGRPLPAAQTRRRLRQHLDHWKRYGYGLWLFRHQDGGRFAGYCGLRQGDVAGSRVVELLYAVASEQWGMGVGTEMAGAVLAVGFTRLGLPAVVSYTLPTNRASRRVMEKQGFLYERDIVHAGLPHVCYRLTATRWKQRLTAMGLPHP